MSAHGSPVACFSLVRASASPCQNHSDHEHRQCRDRGHLKPSHPERNHHPNQKKCQGGSLRHTADDLQSSSQLALNASLYMTGLPTLKPQPLTASAKCAKRCQLHHSRTTPNSFETSVAFAMQLVKSRFVIRANLKKNENITNFR